MRKSNGFLYFFFEKIRFSDTNKKISALPCRMYLSQLNGFLFRAAFGKKNDA